MKIQIPDQILNKIQGMDEKQRYAVFGAVLALVFVMDYMLLMRPQLNSLNSINPKINLLKEDLQKAEDDLSKLALYRKQVEQVRGKYKVANVKVKLREEVPMILEHISRLANDHGVKINQIIPRSQDSELLLENNERRYYSESMIIEGRSSFHKLGAFINQLERENIFFYITNVAISATTDRLNHKIRLTVKAIVYEPVQAK